LAVFFYDTIMPMLAIVIVLFVGGLACGSFINALVWRIHEQSKKKKSDKSLSIINGRSMCVHCKHLLAWYDLVPLFSWLRLRGRCRYCDKPISIQYPIVELLSGLVFAGSYLFWPGAVHLHGQWLLLSTWLAASVGLLALAVYDVRWMLLPNRILYPTLAAAFAGRLAYLLSYQDRKLHGLVMWALSIIISSGFFFVLFMVSKGKWIGYGDVRLGLITGTLLADPQKSLAMLFIASLLGSLVVAPALRTKQKTLASRLPFGPFLITATAILVVFGDSLINWYKNLIL
jgi:prepilin signal peptidase PulO-like enzyme (type II secretory pathway)